MKKLITLSLVAVMLFSFSACAKKDDVAAPKTADIMATIKADLTLPEMADIPLTDISFHTQLKQDDIEQLNYLLAGDGISSDEVLIVKMKDGVKMDDVKTAFETRKKMQSELFEPYAPDEMPKIEKAVIEIKGNYAIFAITDDNAAVKKIFTDAL